MEREVEKDVSSGIMEKSLKENGSKERKMGLECGNLLEVIFMKASGRIIDKTVRDTMCTKEAQNIEALSNSF